jgi:hypothetical protein
VVDFVASSSFNRAFSSPALASCSSRALSTTSRKGRKSCAERKRRQQVSNRKRRIRKKTPTTAAAIDLSSPSPPASDASLQRLCSQWRCVHNVKNYAAERRENKDQRSSDQHRDARTCFCFILFFSLSVVLCFESLLAASHFPLRFPRRNKEKKNANNRIAFVFLPFRGRSPWLSGLSRLPLAHCTGFEAFKPCPPRHSVVA